MVGRSVPSDSMAGEVRRVFPLAALLLGCAWLALLLWGAQRFFWPEISSEDWSAFRQSSLPSLLLCLGCIASWFPMRAVGPRVTPYYVIVTLSAMGLLFTVTSGQLQEAVIAGLLVLGSGLLGFAVLHRLRLSTDLLSHLALAVAVGLGLLGMAVFGMGTLGVLDSWQVLGVFGVVSVGVGWTAKGAIARWVQNLRRRWNARRDVTWFELASLALLGAFGLLGWIGALAPETSFDALASHLALAKAFTTRGQVLAIPELMGSYWPLNGDMLLLAGYLGGGEIGAKLMHFAAGVIAAALVYGIGRRLDSGMAGLMASLVFFTTPIVGWETSVAYTDLFLITYVAAALVFLLDWLNNPGSWRPALGVGLCLGFALGIKPTGGFVAAGVGAAMVVTALRLKAGLRREASLSIAIMALTLVATGGVWYVRAFAITGNPVFPFLNGVFRSPLWYPRNESFNFGAFGFGRTAEALLRLPWDLTYVSSRFVEGPDGALGLLYLALLPLLALIPGWMKRAWPIAVATGVFSVFWVLAVQYLRYLLPALPGLAAMAGIAGMGVWGWMKVKTPKIAGLVPATFLALAGLNLPLLLVQWRALEVRVPLPVVLGAVSESEYRATEIPSYVTFGETNMRLMDNDRLLAIGEAFQYLSENPFVTPPFTLAGNEILSAPSLDSLLGKLEQTGITYLMVNRNRLSVWNTKAVVLSREFLTSYAVPLFSWNGVYLYRLELQGAGLSWHGPNLLRDGGFENRANSSPVWLSTGPQSVEMSRATAHSGNGAVEATGSTSYYQAVQVEPGGLYTLGYWSRAELEGQTSRLQINWLDADQRLVSSSIELATAERTWQWRDMSVTAPPASAYAQVYVSVHLNSAVWFDDYVFFRGPVSLDGPLRGSR